MKALLTNHRLPFIPGLCPAIGCVIPAFSRKSPLEAEKSSMQKYVCTVCLYVYDPEKGDPDSGIAPGTLFEDIPDDWVCPLCQVSKEMFEPVEDA